jgi:hypothetical protein
MQFILLVGAVVVGLAAAVASAMAVVSLLLRLMSRMR